MSIILGKSERECLENLDKCLSLLLKANALVKVEKMIILKDTFQYLGREIRVENGVPRLYIPEYRKEVFRRMTIPESKQKLMELLGAANFLSDHLASFHVTCGALIDALGEKTKEKKGQKFELSEFQKQNFYTLLRIIDEAPSLDLLRFDRTAYLTADASFFAMGSCLHQYDDNGNMKILAYFSKRFPKVLCCNRTSILKEASAILMSIEHFLPLLQSVTRVCIITDLSVLVFLVSPV